MKTYGVWRYSSTILGTRWRWVVCFKTPIPIKQEVWALFRREKYLPVVRNRTLVDEPIDRCYTDWAIPAPFKIIASTVKQKWNQITTSKSETNNRMSVMSVTPVLNVDKRNVTIQRVAMEIGLKSYLVAGTYSQLTKEWKCQEHYTA
jgi:hypothetical protein